MMTPASMVGVPRSVLPAAVAALPAPARAGDRRNARFSRTVAACGGDDQQPSMAPVPASLRAIQAKRKQAAARRGVPRAAATSAAECAVAALVKAVGVVQGAAAGGAAEAARGAGDAVAWVLSKVHFPSPDLAVGLLGMVVSCFVKALEMEAERVRATAEAKKPESSSGDEEPEPEDDDGGMDTEADAEDDLPQLVEWDMEKELWARIGIKHSDLHGDSDMFEGLDEEEIKEINGARARRRKAAYERLIASGGANSLILSNYAQLLYEIDKDIKRAEMYFKRAVAAEPLDGEAMRRYAIFLWHARGNIATAEDMFNDAIVQEPESSQIRSSYAWFLWVTGGAEPCLLDAAKNDGDDAE